jgi:hypothetical protein
LWIFFGLLSFSVFGLVALHARLRASWKGEPHSRGELFFELRENTSRGRLVSFDVGVRKAGRFTFTLQPESALSRLAKSVGLSVEQQLGDPAFDSRIYILSDDPILCRAMKGSPSLRKRLLELFEGSPKVKAEEVRCAAGRLWVRFCPETGFERTGVEEVACRVAPLLRQVADEVAKIDVRWPDRLRDPFLFRAAGILAFCTALAAFGVLGLARLAAEPPTVLLSPLKVFAASVLPSLVVLALLVTAALFLLGRSSRAHVVLAEVVLVGGLGALASGYMVTRDLNQFLDREPATVHEVAVRRLEARRGSKRTTYYVHLADRAGDLWAQPLKVRSDLFHRLSPGGRVAVSLRQGGLGFPWVEDIEPVSSRPR